MTVGVTPSARLNSSRNGPVVGASDRGDDDDETASQQTQRDERERLRRHAELTDKASVELSDESSSTNVVIRPTELLDAEDIS